MRRETDPLKILEERLLHRQLIDEADLKKRKEAIKEEIETAVDFALDSDLPPDSDLMTDILAAEG